MRYRKVCLGLVLLAVLGVAAGLGHGRTARAQAGNRVGLAVTHGDGSTITRCISFTEAEISGYDVLQRSGLSLVVAQSGGVGAAICAIDGEGCEAGNCFCQCQGSPCVYWSYWHLSQGTWVFSSLGASSHRVRDGDVEGWRWGDGSPPPVVSFDQICAPLPTDTPAPTSTPVPPAPTPVPPTATPLPPVVWFRLDANPIGAGSCTMVRWDTSNVLGAYLDGEEVATSGSRQVCPASAQEYRLRVVTPAGEQVHTLTLSVVGTPQPTPGATVEPASPPPALTPPSSTTPTALATPPPSPTPLPAPTSSPTARARAAADMPAPTAIAEAEPPDPLETPALVKTMDSSHRASGKQLWVGYAGLVAIAVGLAGLLASLARRRARGSGSSNDRPRR